MLQAHQTSVGVPVVVGGHTWAVCLSVGGFHRTHVYSGVDWTFSARVAFDVWVGDVVVFIQE